jgi:tetratricopeptide (TPR) repeat protein
MKRFTQFAALLTIFSFAVSLTAARAGEKEDAAEASKAGVEAAKAKDWDKAIASFKKAADLDGSNKNYGFNLSLAHRQRGIAEMGQEKFDPAIEDFSEVLKREPDDLVALRFRAFAYLRKSEWQKSLADYDAALKKKKDDVEPLTRRAFVHMQLKDYDKAIADYSEVIKLKPNDASIYLTRATAYEFKGDTAKAIADYDKVLQLQPTNAEAQNRRTLLMKASPSASPAAAASPAK